MGVEWGKSGIRIQLTLWNVCCLKVGIWQNEWGYGRMARGCFHAKDEDNAWGFGVLYPVCRQTIFLLFAFAIFMCVGPCMWELQICTCNCTRAFVHQCYIIYMWIYIYIHITYSISTCIYTYYRYILLINTCTPRLTCTGMIVLCYLSWRSFWCSLIQSWLILSDAQCTHGCASWTDQCT